MKPGGHAEYIAFLRAAGEVFSPMCPLPQPLVRAGRAFWSVEGLWQGSKVVCVRDVRSLAASALPFEVLSEAPGATRVWFPAAGLVRDDFKRSAYFALLKSGRRHNAARNRWLGEGNWAFAGYYLADQGRIVEDRQVAWACIHRPAYVEQLAVQAGAVARLRRMLAEGVVAISEGMLAAHPHLSVLREAVAAEER